MDKPFLCSAVLLSAFITACPVTAADGSQRAEFNAAYKSYQDLFEKGERENALPFAQRAYELGLTLYGDGSKSAGALAVNYGKLLLLTNKPDEARPVLAKAVQIYETVYGEDSPELIDPLMELGHASAEPGNSGPQRQIYARASKLAEKRDGADSLLYGRLRLEAGAQILDRAGTRDALPFLMEAEEILRKHGDSAAQWRGMAEFYIAKYHIGLRNYRTAEKHLLEALATFDDPDRPDGQMELTTHAFLVEAYQRQKMYDMATNHCQAIGRMTPFTSTQDYTPLFRHNPEYPEAELARRKSGWAQVEFTVDETGSIRDPHAIDVEGGDRFATAAIEAIKDWRFAPRFVDGKPVATEGVQTIIRFEIER